ncbi:MAG: tryptophan synthase subunit alpha [Lysobacterales bacterium]
MTALTNRIDQMFAERQGQWPALVCFVTAGDPGLAHTVPVMHALVRGGASMLELGMPFSDPMADGPVIQAASERALARGADLEYVLGCVAEFREQDRVTPIVLMGYLNPLERFGFEAFCARASAAGVDGLLIVDLPPEEAACITDHSAALNLKQIFLVAPTTSGDRLNAISAVASGFIYYVALKGITGAANLDAEDVARHTAAIREKSALPVAVGFGIKSQDDIQSLKETAAAVVVGTALVSELAEVGATSAGEGKDPSDVGAATTIAENFAKRLSQAEANPAKAAEGAV